LLKKKSQEFDVRWLHRGTHTRSHRTVRNPEFIPDQINIMAEEQDSVVMTETVDAPPADSGATSGRKRPRPRLDLDVEPRKKSRSIFGQVFGTLKKARDQDTQSKASESVKKRIEIDTRIMGKITREQTTVRKQDEAKRARFTANRKEEDLAIKDGILRLRQSVFPRLAGFLLTTDVIPRVDVEDDRNESDRPPTSPLPTASLGHPPTAQQPAALYYLPAKLTKAQEAFLAKQKTRVGDAISEEMKEWATDRKKGVEEVAELRKQAAENISETPVEDEPPERSPATAVKMELEEEKVGDTTASAEEEALRDRGERSVMDADDIEY